MGLFKELEIEYCEEGYSIQVSDIGVVAVLEEMTEGESEV